VWACVREKESVREREKERKCVFVEEESCAVLTRTNTQMFERIELRSVACVCVRERVSEKEIGTARERVCVYVCGGGGGGF